MREGLHHLSLCQFYFACMSVVLPMVYIFFNYVQISIMILDLAGITVRETPIRNRQLGESDAISPDVLISTIMAWFQVELFFV